MLRLTAKHIGTVPAHVMVAVVLVLVVNDADVVAVPAARDVGACAHVLLRAAGLSDALEVMIEEGLVCRTDAAGLHRLALGCGVPAGRSALLSWGAVGEHEACNESAWMRIR